jgi:hypothetical protein
MEINFIDLTRIRIQVIEVELISLDARYKAMLLHDHDHHMIVRERKFIEAQMSALQSELAVCRSSLSI